MEPIERSDRIAISALIPLTDQGDGEMWLHLREVGWRLPFLVSSFAQAYSQSMLEPGTPRPFLRLCTAEGRILAEGPPDAATIAAFREALE